MLACDLILEVRASRSLSRAQVARLERELLAGIDRHQFDLLLLLDRYALRADESWPPLLARAAAMISGAEAEAVRLADAA